MQLSSEREDLRAAVRGLLDRYPVGPAPDVHAEQRLWQRLCAEIGVAGLGVPERFGGAGAGPLEGYHRHGGAGALTDACANAGVSNTGDAGCAEIWRRGSLPAPAAWPSRRQPDRGAGMDDRGRSLRSGRGGLPGEAPVPLGLGSHRTGRERPREFFFFLRSCGAAISVQAGDYVLTGEAHFVLDGECAGVLLVPALMPDGGLGLFEVQPAQPQVTRGAKASVDESRRLGVIRLNGAAGRQIGDRAAMADVRNAACVALSAGRVGAAAAALAMTVAYAKVRVQFGRPIGSFQALQHRMADMHVLVESGRSLSYAAAAAIEQGAADAGLRAAATKAYCSEALQRVSAEMLQLHGAIGMTWEHAAHRYFKRAHSAAMLLGAPSGHVARVAAAVIDSPDRECDAGHIPLSNARRAVRRCSRCCRRPLPSEAQSKGEQCVFPCPSRPALALLRPPPRSPSPA